MRTKPAKTHLPTIAAVLLLSVGFILIGMAANHETPVRVDASAVHSAS